MINEKQQKIIEALREDVEFRMLMAEFAERMLSHLSWDMQDNIDTLRGRLNDTSRELNKFLQPFV